MSPQALSVTEAVLQIKATLERQFRHICVTGEISNMTCSAAGHWYFNLKDQTATLQVALFKRDALKNPLIEKLRDGHKIICSGNIGVYTRRGSFQLVAQSISLLGQGELKAQFEALKKQLAGEGLFDLATKRPLPPLPHKVAVITSERGAAWQDFLKIYRERSVTMDLTLIPALVQGEKAPESLLKALEQATQGPFDVIVLTRGGGSTEDLWAFNHEALARAIHRCPIPILSAVGHEVDFTIADHVADLRGATPSAAAQILTEAQTKILQRLHNARKMLQLKITQTLGNYHQQVAAKHPLLLVQIIKDRVANCHHKLHACHPIQNPLALFRFHEHYQHLDELITNADQVVATIMTTHHHRLERSQQLLHALDVRKVMERGFSYLTTKGKTISCLAEFAKLTPQQTLAVHFHDGEGEVKKLPKNN